MCVFLKRFVCKKKKAKKIIIRVLSQLGRKGVLQLGVIVAIAAGLAFHRSARHRLELPLGKELHVAKPEELWTGSNDRKWRGGRQPCKQRLSR